MGQRSVASAVLIGIVIGALLAVAVVIILSLLRPETTTVLRPWWR
jgi:hypothetical protein